MSSQPLALHCEGVTVMVEGEPIFEPVSAEFSPHRLTAIIGPSGAGKTTLLNCLGLLLPITSGALHHGDVDVSHCRAADQRRFWREDCAFVLQDYGIIDDESLAFNVSMRLNLWGRAAGSSSADVGEVLAATGLGGRSSERAVHLSGGERQRLSIARAIYKGAPVILADEPTASLDADNRSRVLGLLKDRAEQGCTVVIATHDERLIAECDERVEVRSGRS